MSELTEVIGSACTCYLPNGPALPIGKATCPVHGVPVAEPTVAGRKDEPSGTGKSNGLSPQADAGEIVKRLREAPPTGNNALCRDAASLIERQAAAIKTTEQSNDTWMEHCESQAAIITKLEAENERMREALKAIRDYQAYDGPSAVASAALQKNEIAR